MHEDHELPDEVALPPPPRILRTKTGAPEVPNRMRCPLQNLLAADCDAAEETACAVLYWSRGTLYLTSTQRCYEVVPCTLFPPPSIARSPRRFPVSRRAHAADAPCAENTAMCVLAPWSSTQTPRGSSFDACARTRAGRRRDKCKSVLVA